MQGRIVHLTERGYGFVQPTDGGPDIFLHASNFVEPKPEWDKLRIGQVVEYEPGRSRDGRPKAVGVTLMEGE